MKSFLDYLPLRFIRWARTLGVAASLGLALNGSAQLTRVTNTTITLPQNPQLHEFRTEPAFANLDFTLPVGLVTMPGITNRIFVVEKEGRIQSVSGLGGTPAKTLFFDLSSRVMTNFYSEEGLLGVAFHPRFAINRYFYVFYTTNTTSGAGTGRHDRLSRFTALPAPATNADILATEVPLISQYDEDSNHNGGDLHFGADGYLYVALGDEGGADGSYNNSQRIDKDFFSGLLRIDVDRKAGNLPPNAHPAVHAGTYSVPVDNPWVGATSFNGAAIVPGAVRTEFWAVGLRNPWRFSFDTPTGRLFVGDVGQNTREEIDLVTRGGNYGWNYREGTFPGPDRNPPAEPNFQAPLWDTDRTLAASITGGLVYRGGRLPELSGRYIFGDYLTGRVFAMSFPANGPVQVRSLITVDYPVGFGLDPSNSDVLIVSYYPGGIRRLVRDTPPTGTPLPATLSATGVFSDLSALTPAPGVVGYEPNVSYWSDHARKRRWFSIPSGRLVNIYSNWTIPAGAVWVQHFDLELTRGDPTTARRLETRVLVMTNSGPYGATYRWNAAQTDATLVPEGGASEEIQINDHGVLRTQTWQYPGRDDCLRCHTRNGNYALGFNTAQLNRNFEYGGVTQNQLTALAEAGYFQEAVPDPATSPALARADDAAASIEHRVRSYLTVNCSQCHIGNGYGPGHWSPNILQPLEQTGLINGYLDDQDGDPANRVIVPGDRAHSMLLTRISQRGSRQMPPLGSNEVDEAAVALVGIWIDGDAATPFITEQPAGRVSLGGSAATFSVGAIGGGTLTYQWWKDDTPIEGANGSSLTLGAVTPGDSGAYSVVVSVGSQSVTSRTATLLVIPARPSTFAAAGYLAHNPDIAAAIGNLPDKADRAWLHYHQYGISEGRTDGDFSVQAYLAQYTDLAEQFGSDLRGAALHWYTIGRKDGLRIPGGFDVDGYFARNADIAGLFSNDKYGAWLHYYNYGLFEGRSFDANFIPAEYLELNQDLKIVFDSNLQAAVMHWFNYGHPIEDRMGRVPIGFNVDSYLARYPDLAAVFGSITPTAVRNVTVWHHYLAYGTLEGRSDGDFEAYHYLATNPDLAGIFGSDIQAAALHWYFYGRREGRRIPGGFTVQNYRSLYPDVVLVFGDDLYGSWLHYRDNGVFEGRVYDDLFRPADYLALNPDVAAAIGTNARDALLHWLFYGQYEGRSAHY